MRNSTGGRRRGKTVRLWLRDDDAIEETRQLRRLSRLSGDHGINLLLAVIPEPMQPSLAEFVSSHERIDVAVHGLRHETHAREGEKKIELGGTADPDDLLARLETARKTLRHAFGDRATDILVPPWNRIDPAVSTRLRSAGFSAVSAFGWKAREADVPWLNTYVDLIDWRGTRGGKPVAQIAEELGAALKMARQAGYAPVGFLAHHLVHDKQAWASLEQLAVWAGGKSGVTWSSATALLEA